MVELRSILPTETRNISSMNQSITITGLRPYTAYDCTVSAGTVGAGPPTAVTRLLTPEDGELGEGRSIWVKQREGGWEGLGGGGGGGKLGGGGRKLGELGWDGGTDACIRMLR